MDKKKTKNHNTHAQTTTTQKRINNTSRPPGAVVGIKTNAHTTTLTYTHTTTTWKRIQHNNRKSGVVIEKKKTHTHAHTTLTHTRIDNIK